MLEGVFTFYHLKRNHDGFSVKITKCCSSSVGAFVENFAKFGAGELRLVCRRQRTTEQAIAKCSILKFLESLPFICSIFSSSCGFWDSSCYCCCCCEWHQHCLPEVYHRCFMDRLALITFNVSWKFQFSPRNFAQRHKIWIGMSWGLQVYACGHLLYKFLIFFSFTVSASQLIPFSFSHFHLENFSNIFGWCKSENVLIKVDMFIGFLFFFWWTSNVGRIDGLC